MRILICSVSSALGGMERRIEAEVRLLTALGHEVLVATSWFPELEQWKHDIKKAGGRYIVWRPYKFMERLHLAAPFRWLALATMPALRREKFDFAHIAMPWDFVGVSMAYVLSKANIPFVVGIHCKFGQKVLLAHGQEIVRQSMTKLVGGYAVSGPVAGSFMRLYAGLLPPKSRIETVQNGIDVGRFKSDSQMRTRLRQRLGFDDSNFVVIFCGRLSPMKRPLFAVRVFAQLAAKYPNARLLIVGDGAEMAPIKREILTFGLMDKVTFAGQVPDTAPYYEASDCYLSTSRNEEGYSLAVAEALASGLPAVVPNDDIFTAVYGGCGAVQWCTPGSTDGWDAALLSVAQLNEEARQALRGAAEEFALENLSTDQMNQGLTAFYHSVFAGLAQRD